MSYHVINVDTPNCSLSCKREQFICRTDEGTKSVPLEDISAIIVTSFSANVHSSLLSRAAYHGVALVLCEAFTPVSILLPANRATDTILTRAQIELRQSDRDRFWYKTIDAKTRNQLALAQFLAPEHESIAQLEASATSAKPHKESHAARVYWLIFGDAVLGASSFTRRRKNENANGANSLLNYGYAVLLSTTLQKLFAVGIDPTFGIAHVVREHSTPLAYDLMEPFRPLVDWMVADWIGRGEEEPGAGVTPDSRKWMTSLPARTISQGDSEIQIQAAIEQAVRSFRTGVTQKQVGKYKPWIQRSSKWVG